MGHAERSLGESTGLDSFVVLMDQAGGITGIIAAVQGYLDSWPQDRIARLQTMDGGWAPFDRERRPQRLNSAAAVHCVHNAMHAHCAALRSAGMVPTPELLDLDQFFRIASGLIAQRRAAVPQRRPELALEPALFRPDPAFAG